MKKLLVILAKVLVPLAVLLVAACLLAGLTMVRAMKEETRALSREQIERDKGVAVRLESPVRREFVQYLYCDGDVDTPVRAMLRARIAEIVEAVSVDVGDAVERDQLLVKFRTTDLQAEIEARKAASEEAKNNYERYLALLDKGVVSKDVVESRRTLMENAATALSLKQSDLGFAEIRAPIGSPPGERTGNVRVENRDVQPGEHKREGDELLALVDLSMVEVRARVPETGVQHCRPGEKLDFRLEGEEKWRAGSIVRISPSSDNANRFFDVFVKAQNESRGEEWLMRRGMYAEVRIPLRTVADALAVSAGAVKRAGEEHCVYVATTAAEEVEVPVEGANAGKKSGIGYKIKKGLIRMGLKKAERVEMTKKVVEVTRAHKVNVQTDLRAEGYVLIAGGELKDTDPIVSNPRDDLGDGAKLRIIANTP